MSSTHGRDPDEAFFQFDPFEPLSTSPLPSSSRMAKVESQFEEMHDDSSATRSYNMTHSDVLGKGKGVSRPMPILISATDRTEFDEFGSPTWSASSSFPDVSNTPIVSPSTPSSANFTLGSFSSVWKSSETGSFTDNSAVADASTGKGKGKDTDVPTIPPLTFSPTGFEVFQSDPQPSSTCSVPGDSLTQSSTPFVPDVGSSTTWHAPSRRHSYSHSSPHSRRHSIASKFKGKLTSSNKISGDIARRLLSKKLASPARVVKAETSLLDQAPTLEPFPMSSQTELSSSTQISAAGIENAVSIQTMLKLKGRSNSSPLPFSALDIIPTLPDNIHVPIPLVIRNHFDEKLPRELQLQVFGALVALHERDHHRSLSRGSWTVMKAASSKNRWIGKDRGVRELVKLSRVSKSWKALVFDGQLWNALGLRVLPVMHKSQLLAISDIGGHFSTSLNFMGHVHLGPNTLSDITDRFCLSSTPFADPQFTQLTSVNLRGCVNLTTRSLHHLLVRSPALENLCLKGLNMVTNTTCDILAMYCPKIKVLDLNRCLNMDADGIRRLASAFKARGDYLLLKELRLSGLKNVDDQMMATLGAVTPFLEVLDLSYSRKLHNSALDAFVAVEEGQTLGSDTETVLLSASDIGRDSNDSSRYRRRVTRLRHLSLSSCTLLTDQACSNLAHTVPHLELLELAGIGEELKDDGLVRLLCTTPLIRKLDLEDAVDITDSVLAAITPSIEDDEQSVPSTPTRILQSPVKRIEPGHALEHLVISYAANLGDDALMALVRRCRRLTVLEADNTRIGPTVLREFVTLSRLRKLDNAKVVAVDCRLIHDALVRELIPMTRPRLGLRSWDTRKLRYLDGRDFEDSMLDDDDKDKDKPKEESRDAIMKAAHGQDELDEKRVVLKTFYSWQSVDTVWAARDKRRKANAKRKANESSGSVETDSEEASGSGRGGGTRWWSPGGRRSRPSSGSNSPPAFPELNSDGQCVVM